MSLLFFFLLVCGSMSMLFDNFLVDDFFDVLFLLMLNFIDLYDWCVVSFDFLLWRFGVDCLSRDFCVEIRCVGLYWWLL